MSGKAGAATVKANREQKHELGKSANACANKWLAMHRGETVAVSYRGREIARGVLEEFDLYAMIIVREEIEHPALVFKGPGVVIEPA